MTKEMMEFYLQEVSFITKEEFDNCMFKLDDDYEECQKKLTTVINGFLPESDLAWCYFKDTYKDMPRMYCLSLLLGEIYQKHAIDYYEMLRWIEKFIAKESEQDEQERFEWNYLVLKDKVHKNAMVKVYRWIADSGMKEEYCIAHTLHESYARSLCILP